MLKDSIYTDTLKYFDADTYEEFTELIQRNHVGVKCGKWVIMNLAGRIEEENYFEECK
jgi:hypothetical protein